MASAIVIKHWHLQYSWSKLLKNSAPIYIFQLEEFWSHSLDRKIPCELLKNSRSRCLRLLSLSVASTFLQYSWSKSLKNSAPIYFFQLEEFQSEKQMASNIEFTNLFNWIAKVGKKTWIFRSNTNVDLGTYLTLISCCKLSCTTATAQR